VKAEVAGGS